MKGCHEGTQSAEDCRHGSRYQESNGWWYCADPRNPNPFGQENDAGYCECLKDGGGCGRVFSGLSGFDKHMAREGTGNDWSLRCMTDEELVAVGLVRVGRGWWGQAA